MDLNDNDMHSYQLPINWSIMINLRRISQPSTIIIATVSSLFYVLVLSYFVKLVRFYQQSLFVAVVMITLFELDDCVTTFS